MTEDQVVRFCKKYKALLGQAEHSAFFLIKKKSYYLVFGVHATPDGLRAFIFDKDDSYEWSGRHIIFICPEF